MRVPPIAARRPSLPACCRDAYGVLGRSFPYAAKRTRRLAHHTLKGLAEGRLGIITHAPRDFADFHIGGLEELDGPAETVALQVPPRSGSHLHPEPHREAG